VFLSPGASGLIVAEIGAAEAEVILAFEEEGFLGEALEAVDFADSPAGDSAFFLSRRVILSPAGTTLLFALDILVDPTSSAGTSSSVRSIQASSGTADDLLLLGFRAFSS
jgi:hypothetical protein